jgi:hypothetical protein
MKKLNRRLAMFCASIALAAPFATQAQTDGYPLTTFNKAAYMKMADKDGMLSKADVMKMMNEKFDKMQKGGKISVDQFAQMLRESYSFTGGLN